MYTSLSMPQGCGRCLSNHPFEADVNGSVEGEERDSDGLR
jgi:hypothetical protein